MFCSYLGWGGDERGEEREGCPSPRLLYEIDIERIAFGCEVVSIGEFVGKVREQGIGGVEVGVVYNRVERSDRKSTL